MGYTKAWCHTMLWRGDGSIAQRLLIVAGLIHIAKWVQWGYSVKGHSKARFRTTLLSGDGRIAHKLTTNDMVPFIYHKAVKRCYDATFTNSSISCGGHITMRLWTPTILGSTTLEFLAINWYSKRRFYLIRDFTIWISALYIYIQIYIYTNIYIYTCIYIYETNSTTHWRKSSELYSLLKR